MAPPSREEAKQRAVRWLLGRQLSDGAFLMGSRTFEVWDTLIAMKALRSEPVPASALQRGWSFVRDHVREDGIAYHHRNRGTVLACTETTALLHAVHALMPSAEPLPVHSFEKLLEANTDQEGRVRVMSDPKIIPEPLQTYPSVNGFALLFTHQRPEYKRPDHPVVQRARAVLRNPAAIQRPWQYFGTEHYALHHVTWGLRWAGHLERDDMAPVVAYMEKLQTAHGAICNGIRTASTTSAELHTGLALGALHGVSDPRAAEIRERGLSFLVSQQRPDGSLNGGIFARSKQDDLYATSRFIEVLS
jgi:hypothetical protein